MHQHAEQPALTDEQAAVVRDVIELGACARVTAVPGAGKTTLSLALAARCAPGERVLVITYNKNLEVSLTSTVNAKGIENLDASTIHGLVMRQSGQLCSDDTEMLNIVESTSSVFAALDAHIVMIDEAQDLRPLFVQAIGRILGARKAGGGRAASPRIIVCGDPYQMLYDFPSLGEDKASISFLMDCAQHFGAFAPGRAWTEHTFTQSFRLTPHIASFVNAFWARDGHEIVGANDRVPNTRVYYHYTNPYGQGLAQMIQQSIDRYGKEHVLLVGQSTKPRTPLTAQSNQLNTPVHLKAGDSGALDPKELAKKTPVLTACKSKGCEYKVVWFIGFHVYNTELLMSVNQACVGLSRACVELNVVQATGKHIYPIGGDVARIDETYDVLFRMRDEGVLTFVGGREPPRVQDAPVSRARDTIAITECTRVNARDLRAIKQRLGSESVVMATVAVNAAKLRYDIGRSVRGLYYDVSDLFGDAIPMYLQAHRGIAPPQVVAQLMQATPRGKTFTYARALKAFEADGVDVDVTGFAPFAGMITRDELKVRVTGFLTRDDIAVGMADSSCDFEFAPRLRAIRHFCALDGGLACKRPPSAYIFLAAAVRAVAGYRNRFEHMGSGPRAYEWFCTELFDEALRVLELELPAGGAFEHELRFDDEGSALNIVGRADWVDEARALVYELKFTSSLCEEHRLQTQLYGAMLAAKLGRDATAVLFNARTGQREQFTVPVAAAAETLRHIAALQTAGGP